MRRHLLVSMMGIVTLAAAGVAQAHGWGREFAGGIPDHPGYGGILGPRMLAALELSQEQRAQIDRLRASLIERTAETQAALDDKRAQLHRLWTSGEPDREAILAQQAEMDPLRQRLREAHVDFHIAVLAVLTTEQRAKLKSLAEQLGPRGRRGGGKGPGFDQRGRPRPGWGPGPCHGGF